jgi:hypothetical protein
MIRTCREIFHSNDSNNTEVDTKVAYVNKLDSPRVALEKLGRILFHFKVLFKVRTHEPQLNQFASTIALTTKLKQNYSRIATSTLPYRNSIATLIAYQLQRLD